MLGNAWEWVDGGDPTRRTLRGGSFVDFDPTSKGSLKPANHAITPGTRMETTQDSGSVNTSFRCVSALTTSGAKRSGRSEGSSAASREL